MDNITGYTPGKWEVVTDLAAQLFPNEIFIAVRNEKGIFEHPICDVFLMNNKDGKANASLIAAAPSLYEENRVLREQVRVLREAAKHFMYNWDALGNGNDYSNTAAKMNEALSQTETKQPFSRVEYSPIKK